MGWADLHGELLNVILEKLRECTDHLRFSCVCQSWRRAARAHGMPPPPFPWLHLPHDPSAADLRFYSLSEDRLYTIPFPVVRNSDVLRSPGGFLLVNGLAVNPKLLVINPFAGTMTALPYRVLSSPDDLVWDYSGSVFVGSYVCGRGVLCCRPRNHRWSRIKALSHRAIAGIVYTAGSFCMLLSESDEVILLDGETLDETRIIQPPVAGFQHWHWYHRFAVSADAGIHYLIDEEDEWNGTTPNIVFNLNLNLNPQLEKSSWSRIEDAGNCAFVDDKTGRIFVFKATRHPGLRNTIVYPGPVSHDTKVQICNINEDNLNFCFQLEHQFKSSATFSSWILPTFKF